MDNPEDGKLFKRLKKHMAEKLAEEDLKNQRADPESINEEMLAGLSAGLTRTVVT